MWIATGSVPTQAAAGSVAAFWKDRLYPHSQPWPGARHPSLRTGVVPLKSHLLLLPDL